MKFDDLKARARAWMLRSNSWFTFIGGRSGKVKHEVAESLIRRTESRERMAQTVMRQREYANLLRQGAVELAGYHQRQADRCITWNPGPRSFIVHGPQDLPRTSEDRQVPSQNHLGVVFPFRYDAFEERAAHDMAALAACLKERCQKCPYETICLMEG